MLEPGVHVPREARFEAAGRAGRGDQIFVVLHCKKGEGKLRGYVIYRGVALALALGRCSCGLFSGSLIDDVFAVFGDSLTSCENWKSSLAAAATEAAATAPQAPGRQKEEEDPERGAEDCEHSCNE